MSTPSRLAIGITVALMLALAAWASSLLKLPPLPDPGPLKEARTPDDDEEARRARLRPITESLQRDFARGEAERKRLSGEIVAR
jgi:hypothetical protein